MATTALPGLSKRAALRFVVLLGGVSLFADMTYEGARSRVRSGMVPRQRGDGDTLRSIAEGPRGILGPRAVGLNSFAHRGREASPSSRSARDVRLTDMADDSLEEVALATAMATKELSRDEGGESDMVDPLFRALEDEVAHLRQLREAVLDVLLDDRLSREHKLRAIELAFEGEHDTDEDMEEIRDRERLS